MVGLQEKLNAMTEKYAWDYDHAVCHTINSEYHDKIVKSALDRFNHLPYVFETLYIGGVIGYGMYNRLCYEHSCTRRAFNIPESVIILN